MLRLAMSPFLGNVVIPFFIFFLFADHMDDSASWQQWENLTPVVPAFTINFTQDFLEKPQNDGGQATTPRSAAATAAAATVPTEHHERRLKNEPHHQLLAPEHDGKGTLQHVRHHWPG